MCPLSSLPCFSCPILGVPWTSRLEIVPGQGRCAPPGLVAMLAPHPALQVAAKRHNPLQAASPALLALCTFIVLQLEGKKQQLLGESSAARKQRQALRAARTLQWNPAGWALPKCLGHGLPLSELL